MSEHPIPFNRPCFVGLELWNITEAIRRGQISGDGYFTARAEALLEEMLGARRVLLTTSCTHALELSALLLDIKPGDEVIVPSYTFVSTANAFALRGAQIVFADIREDTLNLNESLVEVLITSRTRAIVPVHYAGVGCEMDVLTRIAEARGIAIVEDNAHGLFGNFRGKPLGTASRMSTLSFHETKNITCGEGGALVLNDDALLDRAAVLRQKGTNRNRFLAGQVDKYTWVDLGSSYPPSEILSAMLLAQLESRDSIQSKRKKIWETYDEGLSDSTDSAGVGRPVVTAHCQQSYHMYYLLLPDLRVRQRFISHMKEKGISCVFHYQPLHLSDMGRRFGGQEGACPVTEAVANRLVRLPFYTDLSGADQLRVIQATNEFLGQNL